MKNDVKKKFIRKTNHMDALRYDKEDKRDGTKVFLDHLNGSLFRFLFILRQFICFVTKTVIINIFYHKGLHTEGPILVFHFLFPRRSLKPRTEP